MYKKLKFIKVELKNNKGFGLVQVLVAAALMGVVLLGIVTMLSNAGKSQRGLQAKDRQREVMAELTYHLSDQTACLNSFGGSSPTTPFIKTVIKDALNNAKYTIGTNEGSNLLQYKEFKIQDWVPDAGYTNRGTANLAVYLTKQGDVIGVRDIQQKIGLKVNLDASNNISNCYSMGGGGGGGGCWSESAGILTETCSTNVGVGTATPRGGLDVNATILGKPAQLNAATTIDFSTGNTQYTNLSCQIFNLHNMKDGAQYSFIVRGSTAATCSFNAYSDSGTTPLTVHLPLDNGPTYANTHTLYSFAVVNNDVYISWMTGY